jgi:hypothetical protein
VSWHQERRAEVACGRRLPMGMAAVARGFGPGMSGGFRPVTSGRGSDSGGGAVGFKPVLSGWRARQLAAAFGHRRCRPAPLWPGHARARARRMAATW